MNKTMMLTWALLLCGLFQGGAGLFAASPLSGSGLGGRSPAQARFALIAAAETYLDVPYRYGGAGRRGMDCSGLIYMSFRDALNCEVPRTVAGLYNWVERIPAEKLAMGDIVFFSTDGNQVSHAGIYAGNGRFINAASEGAKTGVIYSRLDEPYWRRTFTGAGRALPMDAEMETARTAEGGRNGTGTAGTGSVSAPDTGFFAGFGLAFTAGAFFEGAPDLFRGIAGQIRVGHKGFLSPRNHAALELRPEWDAALGVFRLPLTLSLGTEAFQIFAGPALTLGNPRLAVDGGRPYQAFIWLGAIGVAGAFPVLKAGPGALTLFGELCWQSYSAEPGAEENGKADVAANLRISLGLRYSWFFKRG
jgi:probable lipoprotein NlpC